jgi:hypothetical protein
VCLLRGTDWVCKYGLSWLQSSNGIS